MTQKIQALALKALGKSFPARELATELTWQDVPSHDRISPQLEEMRREIRLRHGGDGKGYQVLFSGPPGTGKTLTAVLLSKDNGRRLIYIDLPNLISKYIGETEKNLTKLLDRAAEENWLLFFDEADALFGKRSSVKHAHDRYANQEVSYLLKRMETFDDVVIFASNSSPDRKHALAHYFDKIICFSDKD
jgi:SpoVK/Ycf46/Vps4 family AAA+-type ATPase